MDLKELEKLAERAIDIYGTGANISIGFDPARYKKKYRLSVGNAGIYHSFSGESLEKCVRKAFDRFSEEKMKKVK